MSERGSFTTQLMYCPECRKRLEKVLCDRSNCIRGKLICDDTIIAGFLGGCGAGDDIVFFQYELFNEKNAPCHPVRVNLIPDSLDSSMLVIKPDGNVVDYNEFMEENPEFIFTQRRARKSID